MTVLHGLLSASAGAYPDRVAVLDGDRSLTYRELDLRVNRVAHLLLGSGVGRGDRVGIYLDKSLEAVVGLYAAMRAGATYVPLDPRAPTRRLAYVIRNCGMAGLLTGRAQAASLPVLVREGSLRAVVLLDEDEPEAAVEAGVPLVGAGALVGQPETDPRIPVSEMDLAYILYTSGSTGEPKGVMLSHRNALTFVNWAVDLLRLRPDDRLSSHAPLHFDLSIFDLFAAASAGASVVLVPTEKAMLPVEVARFIREAGITVWYSVPSILTMLVLRGKVAPGDFPSLRAVVFAGEVFPTKFLRELMRLVPHPEFHNWYGPTETNVCTAYRVEPIAEDQAAPIPIGTAIADTEVFAVTDEGRLAPPGEEGELYVRGSGVMQGYWGDPERTARVLVPDPRGVGSSDLVYRTGDIVVVREDGVIHFVGRRDSQIKSRGYRIELGDIESALLAHPGVVEAAVTTVPDEMVTNRIRAHLVVRPGVGKADLVRFCAERIPKYMVPEVFEFREALPKTSTGKVDRQALSKS